MNRSLLVLLAVAFAALPMSGVSAAAEAKPNILFIVADDLGWADVGWHSARHKTPHLDRLVHAGLELDQHYVQPVCTPTRAALMSGRVPSRFGPQAQAPSNLRAMPLGTPTLASALKESGYFTAMAGKWHLGSRPEWGPNHYGFVHSYGTLTGATDPWTHGYRRGPYEQTWHRDGRRLDEEGNATELVARQALQWIREKREPWFIYVPFHAVHIPVDAPDEFKRLYDGVKFYDDPEKDDSARRFAAFVSQLDAKVGQFIAALDESGQRGHTLVIFTSDNGGLLKGGNAYVSRVKPTPVLSSNEPLRGQKAELYEGGIRVPAFVNWPGKISPRKVDAPLHVSDWFPTLAALVDWKPPTDLKWDGQNMWPVLTGVAESAPRTIYIPYRAQSVLRDGDWKLIERRAKNGVKHELFDLANDPYEKNDLAAAQPDRVAALAAKLTRIRQDDRQQLPDDLRGLPN
jgi:arylsulfatase A-like enzyme